MNCYECQDNINDDNCVWKNKTKDIKHGLCKKCQRKRSKKHYENNKEYYLIRNKQRKKNMLNELAKYKSKIGCIDCGEKHPACLDFDHISGEKQGNIADLAHDGVSEFLLTEEIKKCVVRCSNCHRKRTSIQFDWYQ